MRARVTVTVRPKAGILDPQGEALRRSLAGLGYQVADVRAGKVFDLELDVPDGEDALRIAGDAAARVLANPLIEEYEVEPAEGIHA
jgi:phosphoribosylformylglycinamidine synthase subunit PurS